MTHLATLEYLLYDPVTVLSIKSCAAHSICVDEAVLKCFDTLLDYKANISLGINVVSSLSLRGYGSFYHKNQTQMSPPSVFEMLLQ